MARPTNAPKSTIWKRPLPPESNLAKDEEVRFLIQELMPGATYGGCQSYDPSRDLLRVCLIGGKDIEVEGPVRRGLALRRIGLNKDVPIEVNHG